MVSNNGKERERERGYRVTPRQLDRIDREKARVSTKVGKHCCSRRFNVRRIRHPRERNFKDLERRVPLQMDDRGNDFN